MTTRSRGPLAGFGWLQRSWTLAFRHPKPLFIATLMLQVVYLAPSLISLLGGSLMLQADTPPEPGTLVWSMLGSMLVALLLVPLYAGYLQVIDAAENDRQVRARDIFRPYREGDAPRLIGYGLMLALIYVVVCAIIVLATDSHLADWYVQALAAQTHQQAPPPLPSGFLTALALLGVFGIFMMGFYAISLGQVALRGHGVMAALGDGFSGALKNLLPLLLFVIGLMVAWIVIAIAMAIVVLLITLLGKIIGTWLALALVTIGYFMLMLFIFAIMFGWMYYMWQDVCSGDAAPETANAISV